MELSIDLDAGNDLQNIVAEVDWLFTAEVVPGKDEWKDADMTSDPSDSDSSTGGDGIPDYRQVLINYVSDDITAGTVTSDFEVITLDDEGPADIGGSTGKPVQGATATAAAVDTVFDCWLYDQGGDVQFNESNDPFLETVTPIIKDAMGGEVYTFIASFAMDESGEVDPGFSDGIPDKYQATIHYISEDPSKGTVSVTTEIVTIYDQYGHMATTGTATTSMTGSTAKPSSGYRFDTWQNNNGIDLGTKATNATLASLSFGATGGQAYTFAASFVPTNSELTIVMNVDKTRANVGDTLTYTITVTNTGITVLNDIVLADTLYADGHVFKTLSLTDAAVSGDPVGLIDLAPAESIVVYATYMVQATDAGKTLTNTVIGTSDDGTVGEGESGSTVVNPVPVISPDPKPSVDPKTPVLNKEDHTSYIIGYEDGTVRPQNNITRAEVATIFFRLLTEESRAYYWCQNNDYTDVKLTDWHNNAISTLANADIITGYPDGTFRPNAPITRAEFAAIAARFSEVIYNGGNSFTDVPENHWAARYIALAEHLGWVTGYPDGSFKPSQNITRAEAMTLINRVLERAVEKEHMLLNMVHWVDNLPGAWYYEAVQEATNSHTYTRQNKRVPNQSFNYETWVEILPVPDWASLEKSWSSGNSK